MAAGLRRMALVAGAAVGIGLAGVGLALVLTWPDNALGDYVYLRRNRAATARSLERMATTGSDPLLRTFYAAWLAEEQGDVQVAISRFRAVSDGAPRGSRLRRDGLLRLGRAYGQDGRPDAELAVYQELMAEDPGASRLSQALFRLRRGQRASARVLLDAALAQDARDGSLGPDRELAKALRRGLGGEPPATSRGEGHALPSVR